MTTFELEQKILELLYRAVATDIITPQEVDTLPERLGCLALNLFDAEQESVEEIQQVVSWLLYRRKEVPIRQKYQQNAPVINEIPPLLLTPEEYNFANRLLSLAVQFGFLIREANYFRFKNESLQNYFCAVYCMKQPIDIDIITRTLPHTWWVWDEIDLDLPDKIWQFILDRKDHNEHEGPTLLLNINSALRVDKSIWSEITKEHIVTLLIEGLKNLISDIREIAAACLSGMLNPRIIEPFLVALKDNNPIVRAYAALGLGTLEENRAIPGLIRLLDDQDGFVRQQTIYALSYIGDLAAVEPLIKTLKYDEDAALYAASVLGKFKDSRAVEPLIEALEDIRLEIRTEAARALGVLGDNRAIEPLELALNDQENEVRLGAAYGLAMLKCRKAL